MKCPNCDGELAPGRRDGVDMQVCAKCGGMWLTRDELNTLEDETFHVGDAEKGSLVLGSEVSTRKCPECGEAMRTFDYRAYDLQLEFCQAGHGFWLDAGEDKRVLERMSEEAARLKRSGRAEHDWGGHLRHWRSPSFIDKLRGLLG